ncbi:hypothetical protein [Virgibacillus oceani]|uniref:Uncharacterized protein n=1 Tax=Virgibacillus oceani TaxID=1479511 RepID=A0A917HB47_9BACI|nr:hypothetical protein [Virgibacillus oceani]GGG73917.1 hypothetical protein GCM10011398_18080 [Virgibacillus oceani]
MNKQTVGQQFQEQQTIKQQTPNQVQQVPQSQQSSQLKELLKNVDKTIQQAQQSIRQVQTGQDDLFQTADQRLQFALQQLQNLKTLETQMITGLPESAKQQLEQAYHEINQAGQTLTFAQQSLNKN